MQDDTLNGADTETSAETVPATEIAKAVKAAKKSGKKKAKAPAKAPKKTAKRVAVKRGPVRKAAAKKSKAPVKKKPSVKPSKPVGKPAKSSGKRFGEPGRTRGPGSPNKIKRRGDEKYANRVRKAREAKGWSQSFLAAKIDSTQPSICNIEKATVGAGDKMRAKLAKALGVKP